MNTDTVTRHESVTILYSNLKDRTYWCDRPRPESNESTSTKETWRCNRIVLRGKGLSSMSSRRRTSAISGHLFVTTIMYPEGGAYYNEILCDDLRIED